MKDLSIVTVSMNRTEHLLRQARVVSSISIHSEHIIIDFGSTIPVERDQLPADCRIKLHRVESPSGRWWLTHSYNLAFALARGSYVLKLDADVLISEHFLSKLLDQIDATEAHLMCNRLTLQDWSLPSISFTTNGLFCCKNSSLAKLRGFNPYIQGWGWDEIDLYSRFFLAGFPVCRIIPDDGIQLIHHGDEDREHSVEVPSIGPFRLSKKRLDRINMPNRLSAQNEKNKQIAVASINQGLRWPSLLEYAKAYFESSCFPSLEKAVLYNGNDKDRLMAELRYLILRPSRLEHLQWRLANKLGFGPYRPDATHALLDAFNIDLSLVV